MVDAVVKVKLVISLHSGDEFLRMAFYAVRVKFRNSMRAIQVIL